MPVLLRLVLLAALAASSAACFGRQLQTVHIDDSMACAGVGLVDAHLAGNPADPRLAWIVMGDGTRKEAVFPDGFSARFLPDLEIVNRDGQVVARAGDVVDGGCVGAPNGALLLYWP